ncbi:hypothetical protein [Jeotgalibacillus marinus]|uniref:Uncharacterized protein n=1 Tax=Jeotgalibacillus marinus TaxID=86667 RepID=A0ABV3Q8U4_9BACL
MKPFSIFFVCILLSIGISSHVSGASVKDSNVGMEILTSVDREVTFSMDIEGWQDSPIIENDVHVAHMSIFRETLPIGNYNFFIAYFKVDPYTNELVNEISFKLDVYNQVGFPTRILGFQKLLDYFIKDGYAVTEDYVKVDFYDANWRLHVRRPGHIYDGIVDFSVDLDPDERDLTIKLNSTTP